MTSRHRVSKTTPVCFNSYPHRDHRSRKGMKGRRFGDKALKSFYKKKIEDLKIKDLLHE